MYSTAHHVSGSDNEELPLRQLLEVLLGPEGRRRLQLRQMSNKDLFREYDNELVLRLHNAKNLSDTRKMLARFKEHLNSYPPSAMLAKAFLAQYANKKARTLYRYAQMIKVFMKWYGEPVDDLKVKVTRSLPPYTEDSDIEKLFSAIESKKTHKGCIVRDSLLVALDLKKGMRRGELAKLEARDIHPDFLVVRNGKGGKDRVIPLVPTIALRLQNFIQGMEPSEKVFKLKAPCITMKIKQFARKAGLDSLHCHSLRHKFATDLVKHGGDIRTVQTLLGHENMATIQVHLSVTDKRLRETVDRLEKPEVKKGDYKKGDLLKEFRLKVGGKNYKLVTPPSVEDVVIPPRSGNEEIIYASPLSSYL